MWSKCHLLTFYWPNRVIYWLFLTFIDFFWLLLKKGILTDFYWPYQPCFSGYSAALKRSRNSNIHVKPHCWRQNLTLFMDKLTSWIYCWCVTPWGGETVPTKHGWMDVSCDIKNTMTFLMLHKINLKSNVKINFLSFKIKKLDFKFLWDQSFCSTPLL